MKFVFAALIVCSAATAFGAPDRPNVLLILVDDMGLGDASCYGGVGVPTPNIDRLAAEGTRFTQFYVGSPICSPSRVAFTTGMFPARWRITSYLHTRAGNRSDDQADFLDPHAPSLARTLQKAGYATGHFGKWHMGGGRDVDDAPLPSAYGFDESLVNSTPLEGPGPALPRETPRWKTTGLFIERTLDFARRQKAADKPFYVNLWMSEVHDWHQPRPEDSDPKLVYTGKKKGVPPYPQDMEGFRRTLKGFDRDLGKLLDGLRELGVDENTLVIFTGDNGPNPLYDTTTRVRTAGLRGQKWSLYEGGTREPFIVRWPGHVPAGRVNDTAVLASVDVFPTVCALVGAAPPAEAKFDGENAADAWEGKPWTRTRPLLWEYGRTASYLKPKGEHDRSPNVAIREGDWKLLVNADGSREELYNLKADPRETKNVATENSDVAERLKQAALAWRKSLP